MSYEDRRIVDISNDINEWFHIGLDESKYKFRDFKENHGITETTKEVIPYKLREEQDEAVNKALAYKDSHQDGKFLWNAKPRFGKTLSTYDFCKKANAKNILIVTNRPAIAKSWFDDYELFFGDQYYLDGKPVDDLSEIKEILLANENSRHSVKVSNVLMGVAYVFGGVAGFLLGYGLI